MKRMGLALGLLCVSVACGTSSPSSNVCTMATPAPAGACGASYSCGVGIGCCAAATPYGCGATKTCYATQAKAETACGNACIQCVADNATSCTVAMPAPAGSCGTSYSCGVGVGCCAAATPYGCGALRQCYATEAAAITACSTACIQCVPDGIGNACVAAQPSGSCPGELNCGGGACCPTTAPYGCSANHTCYASEAAAVAACTTTSCVTCR